VALAALAALVAGCHSGDTPTPGPGSPTPVSSPTAVPVDRPVGFHLQLGSGQSVTPRSPQSNGCPGLDDLVTLGQNRYLRLSAYATSCDASANGKPGNGRHGVYRIPADIPADRLATATKVHTALGDATVFTQRYYECTNSCKNYTDTVAVIVLDHPRDAAYPGLMVFSEKGTVPLDQLETVLRDQLLP
jgi:hypothetical protein